MVGAEGELYFDGMNLIMHWLIMYSSCYVYPCLQLAFNTDSVLD